MKSSSRFANTFVRRSGGSRPAPRTCRCVAGRPPRPSSSGCCSTRPPDNCRHSWCRLFSRCRAVGRAEFPPLTPRSRSRYDWPNVGRRGPRRFWYRVDSRPGGLSADEAATIWLPLLACLDGIPPSGDGQAPGASPYGRPDSAGRHPCTVANHGRAECDQGAGRTAGRGGRRHLAALPAAARRFRLGLESEPDPPSADAALFQRGRHGNSGVAKPVATPVGGAATRSRSFPALAELRNWDPSSSQRPDKYLQAMQRVGFRVTFRPYDGRDGDSSVTQFFPALLAFASPGLLPLVQEWVKDYAYYFSSAFENTLGATGRLYGHGAGTVSGTTRRQQSADLVGAAARAAVDRRLGHARQIGDGTAEGRAAERLRAWFGVQDDRLRGDVHPCARLRRSAGDSALSSRRQGHHLGTEQPVEAGGRQCARRSSCGNAWR